MQYFLVKTKHNQVVSDQLEQYANLNSLDFSIIEEGFSELSGLPNKSVRAIPCVCAFEGNKLIHETDNPLDLNLFDSLAQQKLSELEG